MALLMVSAVPVVAAGSTNPIGSQAHANPAIAKIEYTPTFNGKPVSWCCNDTHTHIYKDPLYTRVLFPNATTSTQGQVTTRQSIDLKDIAVIIKTENPTIENTRVAIFYNNVEPSCTNFVRLSDYRVVNESTVYIPSDDCTFDYAVISFPISQFLGIQDGQQLARVESNGDIYLVPTYVDRTNNRVYVATTRTGTFTTLAYVVLIADVPTETTVMADTPSIDPTYNCPDVPRHNPEIHEGDRISSTYTHTYNGQKIPVPGVYKDVFTQNPCSRVTISKKWATPPQI